MKKATEGDAKLAAKGESETTRKSLAALQRKVLALINLRQGRYNKNLREDPETVIADLRTIYGWIGGTSDGLESSSESLTGLKEAVEGRITERSNEDNLPAVTNLLDQEDEWFLKLIEEREQGSK